MKHCAVQATKAYYTRLGMDDKEVQSVLNLLVSTTCNTNITNTIHKNNKRDNNVAFLQNDAKVPFLTHISTQAYWHRYGEYM